MTTESSALPKSLNRLHDLATDLWWSWHPDGRAVFRRLDYALWRATAHNPVRMLGQIAATKLHAAAADGDFMRLYTRAIDALDASRSARNTWWTTRYPQ